MTRPALPCGLGVLLLTLLLFAPGCGVCRDVEDAYRLEHDAMVRARADLSAEQTLISAEIGEEALGLAIGEILVKAQRTLSELLADPISTPIGDFTWGSPEIWLDHFELSENGSSIGVTVEGGLRVFVGQSNGLVLGADGRLALTADLSFENRPGQTVLRAELSGGAIRVAELAVWFGEPGNQSGLFRIDFDDLLSGVLSRVSVRLSEGLDLIRFPVAGEAHFAVQLVGIQVEEGRLRAFFLPPGVDAAPALDRQAEAGPPFQCQEDFCLQIPAFALRELANDALEDLRGVSGESESNSLLARQLAVENNTISWSADVFRCDRPCLTAALEGAAAIGPVEGGFGLRFEPVSVIAASRYAEQVRAAQPSPEELNLAFGELLSSILTRSRFELPSGGALDVRPVRFDGHDGRFEIAWAIERQTLARRR
ncbi:MAG: hypothetical protein KC561_11035 [Myxococcales bacterium]|nr:hypothetical protein [Myxococcales bacterium]